VAPASGLNTEQSEHACGPGLGAFTHVAGDRVLFPRPHQWHAVRSILSAT
jgi:hypothetical protein